MVKRWLKKWIPTKETVKDSGQLSGLKQYLKSSALWKFDCESVARGVAAGLAGATIPGFQFLYAAVLAILLRGNLPCALMGTFITNPLTGILIVYFIYFIGNLVLGNNQEIAIKDFDWHFSSFHEFWNNFSTWVLQFGKGYLIGVPIVSVSLGIIGYFGTILIWKGVNFFFGKKKS